MSKGLGGKQAFLRDGWFEERGIQQRQPMWFLKPKDSQYQKQV